MRRSLFAAVLIACLLIMTFSQYTFAVYEEAETTREQGGFLQWLRSIFGGLPEDAPEQKESPKRPEEPPRSQGPEKPGVGSRPDQSMQLTTVDSLDQIESLGSYVYTVPDTGQETIATINGVTPSGQDGAVQTGEMAYSDNGNGTITDLNTGLTWTKEPSEKMTYDEAIAYAEQLTVGGYTDWRLPTIKELYSLIDFSGRDISSAATNVNEDWTPFINTDYFGFEYGDVDNGERMIDAQFLSSTKYVGTTMNGNETAFGVNFADGRIKGYPIGQVKGRSQKTFYVFFVRGNEAYGENNFVDNGNGTITDLNTGLMWLHGDSGTSGVGNDGALSWNEALQWADNADYADYDDWRLPNAKELQSIVDYSRAPSVTGTAAINPIFTTSEIIDEGGEENYPFFWTSTLHLSYSGNTTGVYVAFGEALGFMPTGGGGVELMDVHGAGAQRSDPLTGSADDYPTGRGPQGDVIRIENYGRLVRTVEVED